MSTFDNQSQGAYSAPGTRAEADIDQGLRSYMLGVYNYMTIGLALTGFFAIAIAMLATTTNPDVAAAQLPNGKLLTQLGLALYGSPLQWVVFLAPLAIVMWLSFGIQSMSSGKALTLFLVYATLVGVSLSAIFLRYTPGSVAQVFFITSAAFGALSLFGYTTKRDLSAMGKFLFIGVIGIIIAMIVNWFMQSPALQFAISVIGVLVFAGLTAYDTQKIKEMYFEGDSDEVAAKKSVMGALTLYLDFILMFQFLLSLLGNRE